MVIAHIRNYTLARNFFPIPFSSPVCPSGLIWKEPTLTFFCRALVTLRSTSSIRALHAERGTTHLSPPGAQSQAPSERLWLRRRQAHVPGHPAALVLRPPAASAPADWSESLCTPFRTLWVFFLKKPHTLYFSIYNLPHSVPLIDPGAHWATSRTPEEPPHYGKGWCESGPAPRDTLLLAPEAHLPWAAWLTCPSPQALRPAENPQPREAREGRLSVLSRTLIRDSPPSP